MKDAFDLCKAVFGHAARDEKPLFQIRHRIDGLRGLAPGELLARASGELRRAAVEQDVFRGKRGRCPYVEHLAVAICLDDRALDLPRVYRILMAVQLDYIEPDLAGDRVDALWRFIDEDTDRLDAMELSCDGCGIAWRDIPVALRPEDETDERRARLLCRPRCRERLHAAQFRFHAISSFPSSQSIIQKAPTRGQTSCRGVSSLCHPAFTHKNLMRLSSGTGTRFRYPSPITEAAVPAYSPANAGIQWTLPGPFPRRCSSVLAPPVTDSLGSSSSRYSFLFVDV